VRVDIHDRGHGLPSVPLRINDTFFIAFVTPVLQGMIATSTRLPV
jgi:hypothetical protein